MISRGTGMHGRTAAPTLLKRTNTSLTHRRHRAARTEQLLRLSTTYSCKNSRCENGPFPMCGCSSAVARSVGTARVALRASNCLYIARFYAHGTRVRSQLACDLRSAQTRLDGPCALRFTRKLGQQRIDHACRVGIREVLAEGCLSGVTQPLEGGGSFGCRAHVVHLPNRATATRSSAALLAAEQVITRGGQKCVVRPEHGPAGGHTHQPLQPCGALLEFLKEVAFERARIDDGPLPVDAPREGKSEAQVTEDDGYTPAARVRRFVTSTMCVSERSHT
jgi:hypothetical protein